MQFLVLSESSAHNELCQYSDNFRLLKQLKHCGIISEEQQKKLVQCYCNLRDFGHHATLKNEQQLLSNVDFEGLAETVKAICQSIYQSN